MNIIWTPQAKKDLVRIVDIIAADKRRVALKWALSIDKKVSRLRRFPKSGRIVPEVGREDIREIIVGAYRVIYKIGRSIGILSIFHGSKGSLSSLDE